MASDFGFLFGKTIMAPQDLDRWLKVKDFSDAIKDLVFDSKPITDAEVLDIINRILSKNVQSETICGVQRDKLVESTVRYREQVFEYQFKPSWLREHFPSLWRQIRSKVSNEGMVVMPIQMGRFVHVLKFISNQVDSGSVEMFVGGIDDKNSGHITVLFPKLNVTGTKAMDEFFGRLRFCDSIDVEVVEDHIEVALTVPNLMVKESDFVAKNKPKKAWVLQWNQDLKSNLNRGDG